MVASGRCRATIFPQIREGTETGKHLVCAATPGGQLAAESLCEKSRGDFDGLASLTEIQ